MMKAIVTGHSRGLGAAIAAALLSRDVPVLGLSRAAHHDLATRFPAALEQHAIDLSDCAAVAAWLARGALRRFLGGCDAVLLINNAATAQPVGAIGSHAPEEIASAIALNVAVPIMLADAVACAAVKADDKRIVHVSSGAGQVGFAGMAVYCAAKAALDHHARAAALDKTPGVRICSLAPGVVDTDMQAGIRALPLERFPMRTTFDAMKHNGQLSSPEDCAQRLLAYVLDEGFGATPVADIYV